MYKVKVCGVKNSDIIPVLNAFPPDYVGFILSAGFKRSVSQDTAESLAKSLDKSIRKVGVFVNEPIQRIAALYDRGVIDLVQLHGDEPESYVAALKKICPAPVIKAVGVDSGKVPPYPSNCDFLLLDAFAPTARGGTGQKVEWRAYRELDKPFFLAGGITPENVEEALTKVKPYAVDASGGLETDGVKDAVKIKNYIAAVRRLGGA